MEEVGGCVAVAMGICSSFVKSHNDDRIKNQSETDRSVLQANQTFSAESAESKAKIAAVEFNIAFKSPHGVKFQSISSKKLRIDRGVDVNDWLSGLYSSTSWTGWVVYNDQVEKIGLKNSRHGHCKGILAWNNSQVSWLIHSVPDFPSSFTGQSIAEIGESERIYGQTLIHLTFSLTNENSLDKIMRQVLSMDPHIYISHNAPSFKGVKHLHDSLTFQEINLAPNVFHVSKSHKNHCDLYQSIIVPRFGGPCDVETWMRGQVVAETDDVKHVRKVKGADGPYSEGQDHSKWAVSASPRHPWVAIGDLNRMHSQFTRGGGGVVIVDEGVWRQVRSLILE